MEQERARLERRLGDAGIQLPPSQVDLLADYLVLLGRWNARMNLTGIEDDDAAVDRLIVEPVLAAAVIDPEASSLLDIGSGAGSPAVPLKVVRPELSLTMVEVKTRKCVFLREVIRHLGLVDASVDNQRFEALLTREEMHQAVGVVSVRAVRVDTAHLRLFEGVLRPGGQQLWFLGGSQPLPLIPPTLRVEHEVPLPSLRSRLVVLRTSSKVGQ